jgi:major capsid protein gp7
MATLADTHPTLLDLAKRTDPDGKIADIVEILNQTNEVLLDMVWQEGNLTTGNRTTIRSGLPAPTWRKMYGGVQPTKSKTVQVTDNCGMLEAYGEVDKALADLNGNSASFRLSEDRPHIEGMNEEITDTIFYGNEGTEPEAFTGLSPRFNLTTAPNGENVILGGSSGNDNASIWLCVWGPNTGYGIVPKGSHAGLQQQDLGEVTIENVDGAGGRMQAYRSHYRWDAGITLRDWRYFVRIANIDRSELLATAATGANLPNLMFQAYERLPNVTSGRAAWYMDRGIVTKLRQQSAYLVKDSTLTMDNVGGAMVTSFNGIPIRRVDRLSPDEALVA